MRSSAGKIRLTGFDDLFQTTGEAQDNGEQVQYVPLSELFPFKNHPFQVRDDEAMRKTVESIARRGVLTPAIVRPRREGGYEIIAGHRRKYGSELAGKETMPVLVRSLDDDEATPILSTVLHRPADGRSHCVSAGNLETTTNINELPQQSTISSIAGAAFLRL